MRLTYILLFLSFFLSGISAQVKEGRVYKQFILSGFNVKIVDSDKFSYNYGNAPVEVKTIGNALSICYTDQNKNKGILTESRVPLTIYIKKSEVHTLKLVNCNFVYDGEWISNRLRVWLSSSSTVSMKKMHIKLLSVNASAGANLELGGRVGKAKVILSSNSIMGVNSNIEADKMVLNVSSTSKAEVNISAKELKLVSSAQGDIKGNIKAETLILNTSANGRINVDIAATSTYLTSTMGGMLYVSGRTREVKKVIQTNGLIEDRKLRIGR